MAEIVKPNKREQKIIDQRLKEEYGYERNWIGKLKRKVKKEFETTRTQQVQKGLTEAGLSKKEIERLRHKK